LFQVAFPLKRRLRHDSRKKVAPQLADTVMVRQRSAGFQDLVACGILELDVYLLRIRGALVIEPKIKINAHAGRVYLRHTGGKEWFAGQTALLVFVRESAPHVIAKSKRIAPRHRSFE